MKLVIAWAATLVLAGCAAGYSQFYTGFPEATPDAIAAARSGPAPAVPLLDRAAGDFDSVAAAYARRGYAPIGYSSFSSGRSEPEKGALQQGSKVKADLVVVIEPEYVGSATTSVPVTTPTTETSYTSSSATAYGYGGSATAYGDSTTTTYGSRTTYIPMTVHRYEYAAIYFIKRRITFGAFWRDLNDDERLELGTNRGVSILTVVDDSPAYMSDVLPGDIILALDGQLVNGSEDMHSLLAENRGRTIDITIVRRGETLFKSVALAQ